MENNNPNIERIVPDINVGLNDNAVNERISKGLTNKVKNKSSKSYLKIFVDNFCTFFNLLCFACFFVLLSVAKDTQLSNYMFVLIFVANAIIGVIQEIRAKLTVERLSLVKAPTQIVVRNGKQIEIAVSDVVLDDVLLLKLGSQIPADCIVLDGAVEVNESLLTGESKAIKKCAGDSLFSGSFVVGGTCFARADKVGAESYVQTLAAKAKAYQKTNSKLLNALNTIIKSVSLLIIPIAIGTFIVQNHLYTAAGKVESFATGVVIPTISVIIGMIPAGMFFLTTLSLAVGIIKLASYNTLVQDMYSLEMLARTNVLCLDKTGTLTDGQMTVEDTIPFGIERDKLIEIIGAMETALEEDNQTARALLGFVSTQQKCPNGQCLGEIKAKIPFNSERKLSAITIGDTTYLLGAPDFVLSDIPHQIKERIEAQMSLGKRVLLLAKSNGQIIDEVLPENREALGLVILQDNIRPEAIETIKWFKENDVLVKIISGDDPVTVSEIARRAGVDGYDSYINLFGLNEKDVIEAATKYSVFGRVSPEQKALIIKTLKSGGNTVAMTGDGVNDILAMKEADCSITVASGSGAARSLAHLVLLDNNFNCLPKVVKEGRRVVNNIQQSASLYLMKTLFTLLYAVISIASVSDYPFSPGMMLMLEFFIIGIPSVMLSIQPNDKRITGNFIRIVFARAIPGAAVLILNTLAVKILYSVPDLRAVIGICEATFTTMSAIALTLGGLAFLLVLCYPYNKFRALLAALITTLVLTLCTLIVATTVTQGFFGLECFIPLKDNIYKALILLGLLVVDIPMLILFKKIMHEEKPKK